jgi:acyl carrier protein
MTAPVLDQVRQIIADTLNVSLDQVNPESSTDNLPDWDSLKHLNLVLALEQSSGLQFSPEDIDRMLSVRSIAALIEEKLPSNTRREESV